MAPFTGTFPYALDDRNRVPIPPGFRPAFEAGGWLTTGSEPCLVMHTQESFAAAAQLIESLPEESEAGEEARRDFYGNAFPFQKDQQGRVLLVPALLAHASLTKEVVVVGVGRRAEIWDRAEFERREAQRKAARREAMNRGAPSREGA